MWWLGLALFLVCIIEVQSSGWFICYLLTMTSQRHGLDDEDNASWFNIFNIRKCCFLSPTQALISFSVFELVSAYGTVGLSLGLPTASLIRWRLCLPVLTFYTGELLVFRSPATSLKTNYLPSHDPRSSSWSSSRHRPRCHATWHKIGGSTEFPQAFKHSRKSFCLWRWRSVCESYEHDRTFSHWQRKQGW